MSKIKSFSAEGATLGEIDFADELLVLDKGDQAVKDVVVATLAARRAGSASTLGKGEVSGTNRKPWKQKGIGRARSGFTRSPVWVGGGIAMGPKPHSYDQKINKKVASLAFRHALSAQIAEGKVSVIDALPTDGKTKTVATLVKTMGLEGRVLVITDKFDEKVELAIRNIPDVEVLTAKQVDVY
ncbi:MAG: 50S ribosomal protein L4, partial [Clostridia bacterium]|nr:50S ribosomal protein L4 [Clostridia bacterium]